jgi:hypothetical protein
MALVLASCQIEMRTAPAGSNPGLADAVTAANRRTARRASLRGQPSDAPVWVLETRARGV